MSKCRIGKEFFEIRYGHIFNTTNMSSDIIELQRKSMNNYWQIIV